MREELEVYPLFAGLTRPAMVFKVTYEAFVIVALSGMLPFLMTGNFAFLAICIPIYIFARTVCADDPRKFELYFKALLVKWSHPNKSHWGAVSFSPNGNRLCKKNQRKK